MRDPYSHLTIPTKRGNVSGLFQVIVPNMAMIGIEVPEHKRGTAFGVQRHRDAKGIATDVFAPHDSEYKLERAFDVHTRRWVEINASKLTDFGLLARANLMATYGVNIMNDGEFVALQQRLHALISGTDDSVSRTERVVHAIKLYRITQSRVGSRRTLGFASAVANIDHRLADLATLDKIVVDVSHFVVMDIDRVLKRVTYFRERLDKILADDVIWSEEVAGELEHMARSLRELLVARPFTHVGTSAPKDCEDACRQIRSLFIAPVTARSGASEGVRNLIGAARDSLKLLEAQQQMEEAIKFLSRRIAGTSWKPLASEEWEELETRFSAIESWLPPTLGRKFARGHNPVPFMRDSLDECRWIAANRMDPRRIKSRLVEGSNKV